MEIVSLNELYTSEFYISEAMAMEQHWCNYDNYFSCINQPKLSHTFLWLRNCAAKIKDVNGNILYAEKNQMVYMSKGIEYDVHFYNTKVDQIDSFVIHFQLKDTDGKEISLSQIPVIYIENIDPTMALSIESTAAEFNKNIICVPEINSLIYGIIANACKNQHSTIIRKNFACIRKGIDLLENDSDIALNDIAKICNVSEGHFRRLFKEYSGYTPIRFRQIHRIEKAKKLLYMDIYTIGEIAEKLHFADIFHFSKSFKSIVGVSPQNYLKQHNNPQQTAGKRNKTE